MGVDLGLSWENGNRAGFAPGADIRSRFNGRTARPNIDGHEPASPIPADGLAQWSSGFARGCRGHEKWRTRWREGSARRALGGRVVRRKGVRDTAVSVLLVCLGGCNQDTEFRRLLSLRGEPERPRFGRAARVGDGVWWPSEHSLAPQDHSCARQSWLLFRRVRVAR